MRSISTLATLLVGLAVVFWAPAAKADCPHNNDDTHQHCGGGGGAAPSNEFRFIGYSINNTVTGDSGYVGLTQACGAEFPGSVVRVCTTEEFIKSPGIVFPAADAWIVPVHVETGGTGVPIDYSGLTVAAQFLSCTQWTSASVTGLVVDVGGGIGRVSCNDPRPVTCCAPIQ